MSEVIQDANTEQTIRLAEDQMYGKLHYFEIHLPGATGANASLQAEKLEDSIDAMSTNILSVLSRDNCTHGQSWSSFLVGAGLYIQMLQQETHKQMLE